MKLSGRPVGAHNSHKTPGGLEAKRHKCKARVDCQVEVVVDVCAWSRVRGCVRPD